MRRRSNNTRSFCRDHTRTNWPTQACSATSPRSKAGGRSAALADGTSAGQPGRLAAVLRYDSSIAFLGMPVRIIPFHFAHVQSRYLASFWAGRAAPLPKLDPQYAMNDPQRFTSRLPPGADETPADTLLEHDVGPLGDSAYVDAVLSLVPGAGQRKPDWDAEYQKVTDGKGGGSPRYPEGWMCTSSWRRERRTNGKVLRRTELGY